MPRRERPLTHDDEPLTRFAADLRILRDKAGGPSYRELGARAHYSATTLSDAAAGRRLPTLAVTLAYVRVCEGDVEAWEARWHALAAELAPSAPLPRVDLDEAPYLGLAAFQPRHADRFYGRDRLVDDLTGKLARQPFLAVFGASGAGKSSLLRAGLLPALDATKILFTPGRHPLESCALQVASLLNVSAVRVLADLRADPADLELLLRQADEDIVVVVDQFEEVFTLCAETAERDAFISALLAARCRVVIGVRTDFYTHCTRHAALVEAMRDAQVAVGPMSADELRRAITQPAVNAGLTVDGALLAHLVAEAHGQAGVLPLLSHALLETWRRRRGTTLTLTGFQAAGGIEGALARTADTLFESFSPAEQQDVRRLFLRLTAPGEGTEDTKRRIDRSELDADVPASLVQARLLTVDGDTVEITHESLIRSWPRLRDWLAEDRQALRTHRQLTEAAAGWEAHQRDPGMLFRGARLAVAQELDLDVLSSRELEFLSDSIQAEEDELRRVRRQTRHTRVLAAALAVLLVIASTVAVVAVRQQRTAESRALAARAQQNADADTASALRDSVNAFAAAPTTEARSALISSAGRPAVHGSVPTGVGTHPFAMSADGSRMASSDGQQIIVWDLPQRRRLTSFDGDAQMLAFNADNSRLAIGSYNNLTVRNLRDGTSTVVSRASDQFYRDLAFTGDQLIAVTGTITMNGSGDSTVLRFDLGAGGPPTRVAESVTDADGVAVGTTLLVSGVATGVTSWDLATGARVAGTGPLPENVMALSSDGATLATASDGDVVLWDARTLAKQREFDSGSAFVGGIAFGDGVLAVSTQDEVQLWDLTSRHRLTSQPVQQVSSRSGLTIGSDGTMAALLFDKIALWRLSDLPLTGATTPLSSLAFGPSGIVGASLDRTSGATLTWTPGKPLSPAHTPFSFESASEFATYFDVDPTGTLAALTTSPKTIEIHDLVTRKVLTTLRVDGEFTFGHEFSPDGSVLVTEGGSQALVWETRTGRSLGAVTSHPNDSVALGPAAGQLITVSDAGQVKVWDIASGTEVRRFTVEKGFGSFAYGGSVLTGTRADGTVAFWDPVSGRELGRWGAHNGEVLTLQFSPDGRLLATAGVDGKVRLWDVTGRELWATLPSSGYIGTRIAWRGDGSELAVAEDNGVTVWPVSPSLAVRVACGRLVRDFGGEGMPESCE